MDDLGVEALNEYRLEELQVLISERTYKNKPILISTNLSIKEIIKRYGDRITSRLFAKSRVLGIYGQDIRLKKVAKNKEE